MNIDKNMIGKGKLVSLKKIFKRERSTSKLPVTSNKNKKVKNKRKNNIADSKRSEAEYNDLNETFDFDDLENVLDDIGSDRVIPVQPPDGGGGEKDVLQELNNRLMELQNRFSEIDTQIKGTQSDIDRIAERFGESDDNIKKLLSIYEIVSQNINPFVTTGVKGQNGNGNGNDNDNDNNGNGNNGKKSTPEDSSNELNDSSLSYDLDDLNRELNNNGNRRRVETEGAGPGASGTEVPSVIRVETPDNPGVKHRKNGIRPESSPWMFYDQRRHMFEMEDSPIESPFRDDCEHQNEQPILDYIRNDYMTTVLVLRWVEFLLEHISREKLTVLLNYYKNINWISKTAKRQIMAFARGEVPDINRYEPIATSNEELLDPYENDNKITKEIRSVGEWRLTAEDHLKSLLFIKKIAGKDINKDTLNSLEYEISNLKKGLDSFHGL